VKVEEALPSIWYLTFQRLSSIEQVDMLAKETGMENQAAVQVYYAAEKNLERARQILAPYLI
jgi:hypothetical protein